MREVGERQSRMCVSERATGPERRERETRVEEVGESVRLFSHTDTSPILASLASIATPTIRIATPPTARHRRQAARRLSAPFPAAPTCLLPPLATMWPPYALPLVLSPSSPPPPRHRSTIPTGSRRSHGVFASLGCRDPLWASGYSVGRGSAAGLAEDHHPPHEKAPTGRLASTASSSHARDARASPPGPQSRPSSRVAQRPNASPESRDCALDAHDPSARAPPPGVAPPPPHQPPRAAQGCVRRESAQSTTTTMTSHAPAAARGPHSSYRASRVMHSASSSPPYSLQTKSPRSPPESVSMRTTIAHAQASCRVSHSFGRAGLS